MNYLKYNLIIATMLFSIGIMAQQDPNRTLFKYHMILVNPAFAGNTETLDIGVNFRSQWVDVQGAPETQTFYLSKFVGKNVGVGLSVINDKTFIESQTNINADVSYQVSLNASTNLYFGVKAGLNSYNANTASLNLGNNNLQDPSIAEFRGGFQPNVGAGVTLRGTNYYVSISSPNLITTERLEELNDEIKLGNSRSHYYLGLGYDFQLKNRIKFKPAALLRYVNFSPISLDLLGAFSFNDRIELGASYRLNEGVGGLLVLNLDSWVNIAYAYQTAFQNEISINNDGTHEVSLLFKL